MTGESTALRPEDLDETGLFRADEAFLDSKASGDPTAVSVRAAIRAYVSATEGQKGPREAYTALLASIPADHPDLSGGQVLMRSFDGGNTWEVITRPDHSATWSIGVPLEVAP